MKVLLIYPEIRSREIAYRFPTGQAYLATVLINAGIEVETLDLNMLRLTPEEIHQRLVESLPAVDVVGTGGLVTAFLSMQAAVAAVKRAAPEMPVIVGGPVASYSSEVVLKNTEADYAVLGEGETAIVPLLRAIAGEHSHSDVKGVAYLEDGEYTLTTPSERISDLDSIGFPAYESFDVEQYIDNFESCRGTRGMNMIASRGCPFSCFFCARNFGTGIKYRSVENVLEEIEMLRANWGVDTILFNDELFVTNKKWVHEFCDGVIRRNVQLVMTCTGKPNCVDRDLLTHMKEAGFEYMMYGVESNNESILKQMNKRHKKADIDNALKLSGELGIGFFAGLIIGMPEETHESVRGTIELCKKFEMPLSDYYFLTPYPGTALYNSCIQSGLISDPYEYVKRINDLDITELALNLTRWSDDELKRIRQDAINEVAEFLEAKRKAEEPPLHVRTRRKIKHKLRNLIFKESLG